MRGGEIEDRENQDELLQQQAQAVSTYSFYFISVLFFRWSGDEEVSHSVSLFIPSFFFNICEVGNSWLMFIFVYIYFKFIFIFGKTVQNHLDKGTKVLEIKTPWKELLIKDHRFSQLYWNYVIGKLLLVHSIWPELIPKFYCRKVQYIIWGISFIIFISLFCLLI